MTDRWSARAELYRDSDAASPGATTSSLLVRWCGAGLRRRSTSPPAAGTSAHALRAAGFKVVTVDPPPGMQARRASAAPRSCRSPTRASTPSSRASRRTTSRTFGQRSARDGAGRAARRPRSRTLRYVRRGPCEQAERLRDPTHVRSLLGGRVARAFEQAGLDSRGGRAVRRREAAGRRRLARADGLRGRGGRRGSARCWATGYATAATVDTQDRCSRGRKLVAIIVDRDTRLVVQGITGREGSFHTLRNRAYGTNVVAGVTPGQGRRGRRGDPGLRHRLARRSSRQAPTRRSSSSRRGSRLTRSSRRRARASARSSASPRAFRRTTCSMSTGRCAHAA